MSDNLVEFIKKRKEELNAVIMAHYYQRPEIQDLADMVGDSLQLARYAANTDASVIVFCGVSFMAESAKILSPEKLVIMPEPEAGCPMADMITGEKLREWRNAHPGAQVVCYVNSSADVKAESDICCTSSNAIQVVSSIPPDCQILFVPDQNLGRFLAKKTGREIECWPGYCPTHHNVTAEEIREKKALHPGAPVLVHPECRPEVIDLADEALSTGGILKYVEKSPAREFIIGTEIGLLHQLQTRFPDRVFHIAREEFVCPNMKLNTLANLAQVLDTLEYRIEVPEDIREKAYRSLERMLNIS
ncbi:MAG: quinolinate synthase NadA [Syntrophomonadaceae bacterium]|nr:quinolinate synthase NadA [Syntrophomonadaceae bacterium]